MFYQFVQLLIMVSIGLLSIQWIGQAGFLILIRWIVIYLLNNSTSGRA